MFERMSEEEARSTILASVREYCDRFHMKGTEFHEGDRIPYASRVYGHEEMENLVDSALEFWLTAGRYTERFEREFAEYLGVRHVSLVNSGSSANLLARRSLRLCSVTGGCSREMRSSRLPRASRLPWLRSFSAAQSLYLWM